MNTHTTSPVKGLVLNYCLLPGLPPGPEAALRRPRGAGETETVAVAYKIRTTMSVDALAYLIRLMVEAGLIEPGVRMELMTSIGALFQTPGTGANGISAGSLNNKYKLVVHSTAVTMRGHLLKMLKLLDNEFR